MRAPITAAMLMASALALSGCGSLFDTCGAMKDEYKELVAEGAKIGLDATFTPEGQKQIYALSEKVDKLKARAIQKECNWQTITSGTG